MKKKRLRVRVTSVQVELNDEDGSRVDCYFERPRKAHRQRRLSFVGEVRAPTRREARFISKAVRAAIRAAERAS